ncbi:MAG: C-GCAxxG-C-C family protein [Clostridiales Family XIII bacterium]|jgi:hypothetical protein|nr:C-GCAxxG-C-C family protein [Clostridiales Family XIII bacterium]
MARNNLLKALEKGLEKAMDVRERIFDERLKGHCCSETIMSMCLADLGRDGADTDRANADLVRAMGAFCGGLGEGLACGTLCAAVGVLHVACEDPRTARGELQPVMMRWFFDRFGSCNCAELLDGDETRKLTHCPVFVEETYLKLREMLEDIGVL